MLAVGAGVIALALIGLFLLAWEDHEQRVVDPWREWPSE